MIILKKSTTFFLSFILLDQFSKLLKTATGAVTIAPFPNAAVCRVGDQLEVTCSTNSNALDWEIVFAETNDRIDSTVTSTQQIQEVVPSHSTVFIFSRTSELGTIPLVSTLDISSVELTLNGSNIICTDSTSNAMATIMVHIIGENDSFVLPVYHPNPPEVSRDEQFGVDSVTVFLQWTKELNNPLVAYHVSVEPMAHINTGNGRANLTLLYNTPYNVNVVADVCGKINATTTFMRNYVNCGAPLSLDELASSVMVMGYCNNGIALEGDSVSFTCSSGLVLTGPNSSTCMGNGEWEPDPGEVACKGDAESTSNSHRPLNEAGKIAVTSVSMFLVTFALAFTIGYVVGHYFGKQERKSSEPAEKNEPPSHGTVAPTNQELEIYQNVAYSTVQPVDTEIDNNNN